MNFPNCSPCWQILSAWVSCCLLSPFHPFCCNSFCSGFYTPCTTEGMSTSSSADGSMKLWPGRTYIVGLHWSPIREGQGRVKLLIKPRPQLPAGHRSVAVGILQATLLPHCRTQQSVLRKQPLASDCLACQEVTAELQTVHTAVQPELYHISHPSLPIRILNDTTSTCGTKIRIQGGIYS